MVKHFFYLLVLYGLFVVTIPCLVAEWK